MKTRVKISILVFSVIIFSVASVRAATVIGETISTTGLTVIGTSIFEGISRFSHSLLVTNQAGDEAASLKVDGTHATTSVATIETVGTTSRLMLVSGESLWPTTWSLGINTGLDSEPNQDFQIRQVSDGTGLVNEARLTILKSNGMVGIGTTTPEYKLDVNGDINVSDGSVYKYNGVSVITASTTRSNFFFGNSGNLTMSGYNNNALGENAFISNTIGVTNVAFGYEALKINTTGDSNTALGALSLNKNVSGNNNVAIGEASLFTNNSGDYNVAVGSSALGYNSSGANNTALGRRSGASNEIGSGNVFLGFEAGYYETGSNKLYISNSASVATSSLIYGEFDNNILSFNANVGIGTTTPLSKFTVIGSNSDNSSYSVDVRNSDNNNLFSIRDDGKIFIGKEHTSALANKLTIYDSASARLQLEGPLAGININSDNVGDLFIQGAQSAITSYHRNSDYEWSTGMVGDSDNNFSIWFNGTTNPGAKLSIATDGKIGIGTSTPEANLHVYGGDTATSTVQVGGEVSTNGSCLKLRDRDGSGWTYCTTLDGALECSITPCN